MRARRGENGAFHDGRAGPAAGPPLGSLDIQLPQTGLGELDELRPLGTVATMTSATVAAIISLLACGATG
jgi:hypothetical protein